MTSPLLPAPQKTWEIKQSPKRFIAGLLLCSDLVRWQIMRPYIRVEYIITAHPTDFCTLQWHLDWSNYSPAVWNRRQVFLYSFTDLPLLSLPLISLRLVCFPQSKVVKDKSMQTCDYSRTASLGSRVCWNVTRRGRHASLRTLIALHHSCVLTRLERMSQVCRAEGSTRWPPAWSHPRRRALLGSLWRRASSCSSSCRI